MKAIVCTQYGSADTLRLVDVAKLSPKDNEVLVKVFAVGLNSADTKLLEGKPFILRLMGNGLFSPKIKILGADIAGRVESVGTHVTQFKVGDAVFGDVSSGSWGGLAEYVCASENALALKPENISFEEAAAVPMAAVTALQGLRTKGKIAAGQKVLVNGASGGVGTFAVQIAKAFGAEVTAVCSTKNVENARSLGADHVIDYTKEDFTKNKLQYDLIIAANGYHTLSEYQRALTPNGTYVMTGGTTAQIFEAILIGPLKSRNNKQKFGSLAANSNLEDLKYVASLLGSRKIIPAIDRCYPLQETAEAFRYVGQGHAAGKVIITVHSHNN
jgi:NADPH:quinone reductase-like Zn-dependent oxidoreductase